MKLNCIGQYFGSSGYAVHTKQLSNAINDTGVEVSITTNKPVDWVRGISDNELKMLMRNPQESDINLMIGLPFQWKMFMNDGKPFIGFVVFEGSKTPLAWNEIFLDDRVKQIWCPSQHTKDAILNSIVGKQEFFQGKEVIIKDKIIESKIRIVPHGVDLSIFKPLDKPKEDILRFVASKGWPNGCLDRGGLSFLLKAFIEEFTSMDKVELVVKLNTVYGMTQEILNRNIKQLDVKNLNKPTLKFIINDVPYNEMNRFYNIGDVFVSTSLAEGFNLNGIESMACGLPNIQPDYGGQMEYINEKNSWILKEGKMKQVLFDNLYEGVSWKTPSIDEIRKTLRYVYEHQEEVKVKSVEALKTAQEFTWNNSGIKAKKFLDEIKV